VSLLIGFLPGVGSPVRQASLLSTLGSLAPSPSLNPSLSLSLSLYLSLLPGFRQSVLPADPRTYVPRSVVCSLSTTTSPATVSYVSYERADSHRCFTCFA
jgi:hypothetical protein